jgi:hypothetical protein
MCAHLFAASGMKSADEGLSARQADAVSRWRRSRAGQSCDKCRDGARRGADQGREAVPMSRIEEQAVLRCDTQGDRLQKLIVDL